MALLFSLSLVPFSTAYLGEQHFSRDATLVYLVTMLLPSLSYAWLQWAIRKTGAHGKASKRYHETTLRKGLSRQSCTCGFVLTFVSSWLGIGGALLVAIFWFLPESPLDGVFAGD